MALQIGMIGTGGFAAHHARLLTAMKDVVVAAVCGTSQNKAALFAQGLPSAASYSSVSDMLDGQPLDAVYICVPPFAHGDMELELIARNIPFLIEKPLGVNLATPSTILAAIEDKKLITSVGYHLRYLDGTAKAKELLADHTPGMALGSWNGGMPGASWWRQAAGSGGQFVEQTTHLVDLLRYCLGEIVEVYAAYALVHPRNRDAAADITVPDVGTVTLKLASGAIANLSNTCMLPVGHETELKIFTDHGVLELGPTGLKNIEATCTTQFPNRNDVYQLENEAFLHAVRTGDTSGILSTYADAWRTQQITVLANESALSGLPIKL
ncbi:oxidoreductase [Paenibacillus sp. 598K]|uniref:Gfo/Idh/MocA family protein n=1 Tax=Paenibacillus sp. 598K TaxID=1117987 RepID=UPI000FF9F07D|nr:Gfo/Idh/MocA family oxidoreductase [Paenibacillus sp. 598K]GBF71811.1 oxidoreductase [Paenibacillus sp. 598K]